MCKLVVGKCFPMRSFLHLCQESSCLRTLTCVQREKVLEGKSQVREDLLPAWESWGTKNRVPWKRSPGERGQGKSWMDLRPCPSIAQPDEPLHEAFQHPQVHPERCLPHWVGSSVRAELVVPRSTSSSTHRSWCRFAGWVKTCANAFIYLAASGTTKGAGAWLVLCSVRRVDYGSPRPPQLCCSEVCWFRDGREGPLFSDVDIGWAPPSARHYTFTSLLSF